MLVGLLQLQRAFATTTQGQLMLMMLAAWRWRNPGVAVMLVGHNLCSRQEASDADDAGPAEPEKP